MSRQGKAYVLSDSELKRLRTLVSAGRHGQRNECLIDFSFLLGMRSKEMSLIRVDQVVDGSGEIKSGFLLEKDQTKTENREIYLSHKALRKRLKEYIGTRRSGLLFRSQKGAGFTPNTLGMLFKGMYKSAGIVGAKSHSGRRSFATKLIERGYDIKSVSILMGHASITMTEKYFSANPYKLSDMVAGM